MKYKKLLASCFIFIVAAQATFAQSNINFIDSSLTTALKEAKTQNKPVFFMGYASWCPHCNNMKEKVFTNPTVANFFNQQFICIAQDMQKGEGIQLQQTFGVKSYPTFIFLDSDGNTLYRTVGEFDTTGFLVQAQNSLDPKQQLPYLKQQFEADVSNANNCYAYAIALRKGRLDYQDVVHKYLATQSEAQLLSNINLKLLAIGITDLSSREFNFVINHMNEFAALSSKDGVERKIASITYQALFPLAKLGDTAAYFHNRKYVSTTHLFKVDSVLFLADIHLYERLSDWNAYQAATLQFTDKYVNNNFAQLKDIAGKYLKNIADDKALLNAVQWAQQALALHEDYRTAILCAKLYEKLNDKQKALTIAKQAKDIAVRSGLPNTSEADNILTSDQINK
jgi:thioredoxin-related protein